MTFDNIVSGTISKPENTKVKVIKSDTEYLAFYAYTYLQNELTIHFLRLKPRRDSQTLFMQLIADFISKAIKRDIPKIIIKEICLADKYKATLSRMGFDEQVDSATWIKYLCNNIISKDTVHKIV